ncbi:MAG: sensor histidine kinase [Enterococcus sp.]
MNNFLQIVSFLITGLTMTLVIFNFLDKMFQKRYATKKIYYFAGFIFFIAFVCSMLISTPLIRLFFPAILPIILGITLYSDISIPLIILLIFSIELLEMIVEIFTNLLFNSHFMVKTNDVFRNLLIFFIYQLVMSFVQNKKIGKLIPKQKLSIFLLPMFSFLLIYFGSSIAVESQDSHLFLLSSIYGVGLLLTNLFMFYLFERIQTYVEKEMIYQMKNQHSKLQYQYIKNLESKNLETKKFLHDMKRHLAVLDSLKKTDELTSNYLLQLHSNLNHFNSFQYTGSPIINLLINSKKQTSIDANIQYNITCEPLSFSFMEEIDQTTLFSNMIDNAFDECLNSNKSGQFVTLTICSINDFKVIHICNSYEPSKIKDSKNHFGLGIINIKDVVEKYHGELSITKDEKNGVFEIQALFFQ